VVLVQHEELSLVAGAQVGQHGRVVDVLGPLLVLLKALRHVRLVLHQ